MARTLQYLAIVEPIPPQSAAASNAPVGIEWYQPLSEPLPKDRAPQTKVVNVPFGDTTSATPSILWFQPLSEPQHGRKPTPPESVTAVPGVFTSASNAPSGIEWHQPLSLPQYGHKPPTLEANTLVPGVFTTASNGPTGIEWLQPLSLPQYRRTPAYSQSILYYEPVVVPPSEAGSCVSFCNVDLKVSYFVTCDLKVAYFSDSEFCPGGQC